VLWWNPEPTMANKTFSNSAVWCNTIKYGWAWTSSSRVHDRTNRRVSSDVSCKRTGLYSAYVLILHVQNVLLLPPCHKYESMYSTFSKSSSFTLEQSMQTHRSSSTLHLTSVLDGGSGINNMSQPLTPSPQDKDPSTRSTGGWVGPGASLDRYQKSRPHNSTPRLHNL
jgi:hypothetical protein